MGKELWEIGLFEDIEASKAAFQELQEKGYIRYEDLPLETKDARRIDVEFVSNVYRVDGAARVRRAGQGDARLWDAGPDLDGQREGLHRPVRPRDR